MQLQQVKLFCHWVPKGLKQFRAVAKQGTLLLAYTCARTCACTWTSEATRLHRRRRQRRHELAQRFLTRIQWSWHRRWIFEFRLSLVRSYQKRQCVLSIDNLGKKPRTDVSLRINQWISLTCIGKAKESSAGQPLPVAPDSSQLICRMQSVGRVSPASGFSLNSTACERLATSRGLIADTRKCHCTSFGSRPFEKLAMFIFSHEVKSVRKRPAPQTGMAGPWPTEPRSKSKNSTCLVTRASGSMKPLKNEVVRFPA